MIRKTASENNLNRVNLEWGISNSIRGLFYLSPSTSIDKSVGLSCYIWNVCPPVCGDCNSSLLALYFLYLHLVLECRCNMQSGKSVRFSVVPDALKLMCEGMR